MFTHFLLLEKLTNDLNILKKLVTWNRFFPVGMEFHFDDDDLIWNISNEKPVHSRFDSLLKNQWEIAAEAGVCRYRLTNLQTKILQGKYGFVAQVLHH